MPDKDKLPETATGAEVLQKFESLPAEVQAQINLKYLDLEIAESKNFSANFQAAVEADKSGNTTRPEIARLFAYQIFVITTAVVITYCYGISSKNPTLIDALTNSWPFILSTLGTQAAVIRAYFGMRSKEKNTRYAVSAGQEPPKNILETILGR